MKKFKSKKIRKKINIISPLFFFLFVFLYIFIFYYFKENPFKDNVLNKNINYINFNLTKYVKDKTKYIINEPINLIHNNIKNIETKKEVTAEVMNDTEVKEEKKDEYNPVIYIYNTHQTEKYNDYTVVEAAELLSQKLNDGGYDTYFEEQSIPVFLQENNFKYYKSYVGSRKYLMEAKEKYLNLTYFFDVHRDALKKEKSTLEFNGKKYAKISFIVGLENKNYQGNLENTTKINEIINSLLPGLSRGILKKSGEGVNGIYNQDISSNIFLIEIGGNENNKEEVINTVEIINEAIKIYIKGII